MESAESGARREVFDMPPLSNDTIVALATAAGPGARAIVRLSGPASAAAVRAVFSPADQVPPPRNRFVDPQELLMRLGKALAQVTLVSKQLDSRAVAGGAFRVVLAGRPNAGKSSLFNALAAASALVSDIPGTTRDYLVRSLPIGGA